MLNEIRRVFRMSMEAFRAELTSHDPEDQVTELLSAMRRELVAAKAALPEYEVALDRDRAELGRERVAMEDCERRRVLADRIADSETAKIAREFAERHREKAGVLEQKVLAAEAELVLRKREVEEMRQKYKEADTNRFALLAQLRMAASSERRRATFSTADGAFADFERMQERMQDDANYVDALEELDDSAPPPETPPPSQQTLDERLAELKRRMGKG